MTNCSNSKLPVLTCTGAKHDRIYNKRNSLKSTIQSCWQSCTKREAYASFTITKSTFSLKNVSLTPFTIAMSTRSHECTIYITVVIITSCFKLIMYHAAYAAICKSLTRLHTKSKLKLLSPCYLIKLRRLQTRSLKTRQKVRPKRKNKWMGPEQ